MDQALTQSDEVIKLRVDILDTQMSGQILLNENFAPRLDAIESKLEEFEDYFNTIESILIKIQAVYEAIKEQGDHA